MYNIVQIMVPGKTPALRTAKRGTMQNFIKSMPDLNKRTKRPAKGEGGAIFQRNDKKTP